MGLYIQGQPGALVVPSRGIYFIGTYTNARYGFVCDVLYDVTDMGLKYFLCVVAPKYQYRLTSPEGKTGVWAYEEVDQLDAEVLSELLGRKIKLAAIRPIPKWVKKQPVFINDIQDKILRSRLWED